MEAAQVDPTELWAGRWERERSRVTFKSGASELHGKCLGGSLVAHELLGVEFGSDCPVSEILCLRCVFVVVTVLILVPDCLGVSACFGPHLCNGSRFLGC